MDSLVRRTAVVSFVVAVNFIDGAVGVGRGAYSAAVVAGQAQGLEKRRHRLEDLVQALGGVGVDRHGFAVPVLDSLQRCNQQRGQGGREAWRGGVVGHERSRCGGVSDQSSSSEA